MGGMWSDCGDRVRACALELTINNDNHSLYFNIAQVCIYERDSASVLDY
jgi:hypothetical protein